jgi:hypothetical protein
MRTMARPKPAEPEKQTGVRLPMSLWKALSELAVIDDRNLSWEFRNAVKKYVESRAKELKQKHTVK